MKPLILALLSVLLPLPPALAADIATLRIHGSNTVGASLAPALLTEWLGQKGYHVTNKKEIAPEEHLISAQNDRGKLIRIELHAHGSSTAFRDLAAGSAELGMASRPIKEEEIKKLAPLGDMTRPDAEYVVALDGLSVIVNAQNPLRSIDKQRLKKIFSGEISRWSQLGIRGGRIHVYARDNKSGTYDTFKSLVLDKQHPLVKTARRYESNARLSDDVAQDRNGIGFVGLAYVRRSKALAISDAGGAALPPLPFNVSTEDYALARRLFLYLPEKNRTPLLDDFVRFAISAHAQPIVDQVGFVSQKIHAEAHTVPEQSPPEYRQLIRGAKRLSLNIRFRHGMVKLDNKAVHDVQRLAEFVKLPANNRRRIMLFGFADSNEALPYASFSLSVSRADSVADQFVKNHITPFVTRGYGAELPVASNMTDKGRKKNRRVEVWIK